MYSFRCHDSCRFYLEVPGFPSIVLAVFWGEQRCRRSGSERFVVLPRDIGGFCAAPFSGGSLQVRSERTAGVEAAPALFGVMPFILGSRS